MLRTHCNFRSNFYSNLFSSLIILCAATLNMSASAAPPIASGTITFTGSVVEDTCNLTSTLKTSQCNVGVGNLAGVSSAAPTTVSYSKTFRTSIVANPNDINKSFKRTVVTLTYN